MKLKYLPLAISAALATATSAFAADAEKNDATTEENIEVIQVKGVLSSLKEAQEIKKIADNVVDALVAEDIGKFPDANVAEALQRIPGISVSREHGEGRNITVRGLTGDYNVTTLNGRKLASETVGRDFNYDLIASELVGGIQVNKTQKASLPEGGIGAVINIDTRRPLDLGSVISGSADATYTERAGDTSPNASLLVSETFADDSFGALFSLTHTESKTRFDSHSAQWGWNDWTLDELVDGGDPNTTVRFPNWPNILMSQDDRQRTGGTLALQWRPSDDLNINFDALYTKYDIVSTGKMISLALFEGTNLDNIQEVTVRDDGWGESITIGEPGNPDSPAIAELLENQVPRASDTYQLGLNVDWMVDHFTFNFDAAYSQAEDASADVTWVVVRTAVDSLKMNWGNGESVPDIILPELTPTSVDYGGWYARRDGDKVLDKTTRLVFDGRYEPDDSLVSRVLFGAGYNSQDKRKEYWLSKEPSAFTFRNGATESQWVHAPDSAKTLIAGNTLWGPLPQSALLPGNFDDFMGNTNANIPRNWASIDLDGLFDYYRSLDPEAAKLLEPVKVTTGGNTYGVKEATLHAYAEVVLEDELFGLPYLFDLGLRYIDTQVTSWGYSQDPANIEFDADGVLSDKHKLTGLVEFDGSYRKLLPSMNFKLALTDELVVRLALSQAMSRPPLTHLSPVTSIWQDETTLKNGIYENDPGLKPYYADQLDTAIEWYYSDSGTLNLASFYKELHGFVTYQPTQETIAGQPFEVTRPYNDADNASRIRGYEVNWLQTFDDFLPESLAGFGVSANYTYNNSTSGEYDDAGEEIPFRGLSRNQYNVVAFYEQHGLMVNFAYNYRSAYNLGKMSSWGYEEGGWYDEELMVNSWGALDLSMSYEINDQLSLTFDANNLLDPDYKQYIGNESHIIYVSSWGRSYNAGIRFTF